MNHEQRVLNFLITLHRETRDFNKANVSLLLKQNKLQWTVFTVLREEKMILKRGYASGTEYKWNSIQPNILMAKTLLERVSKIQNSKGLTSKPKRKYTRRAQRIESLPPTPRPGYFRRVLNAILGK